MTDIIKALVVLLMFTTTPNTQVTFLNHLEHHHAYIAKQIYELHETDNEYHLVELENGSMHEVETTGLKVGDPVTVWFFRGEPVMTMYNWR